MREIRLQIDDALMARLAAIAANLDCSVETLVVGRLQGTPDATDVETAAAYAAAEGLAATHWNQEESACLTDAARASRQVPRSEGVFSSNWDGDMP
jgi:hypothetical protein